MWQFLKCLFSLADRNRAVDMIIEFRGVLNLISKGGIFAEECVCGHGHDIFTQKDNILGPSWEGRGGLLFSRRSLRQKTKRSTNWNIIEKKVKKKVHLAALSMHTL